MIPYRRRPTLVLVLALGLVAWIGCRSTVASHDVIVQADGKAIPLSTTVLTVREVLAQADVVIDEDDRVEPDLWVELASDMVIRVIRVQEEIIVEREVVPYRQQTIKSESIPTGEQRLLQAGKNGQIEVTYRLQFEDGVEISRAILRQIVVTEPADQITVVGVEGLVDSVQFDGTIAYLNGGNAWLMRGTSGGRQPVTSEGNLDGRVFALSPNGAYLLYSVITETVEFDGPFNDLFLLNVALAGEEPVRLPIRNVLWAEWAPEGQRVAYSTGVKSGPPGWKASNDLWLVVLIDGEGEFAPRPPKRIVNAQSASAYSWWGTRYAWSPDGEKIAYARPDQVGWIDVSSQRAFPLAPFAPLTTHGDWVWVPSPTWSPDSWFVACTIHVEELGRAPQESQQFEIWAFDINRQVRARLTARPVGMWSTPRWSPAQQGGSTIAYAEAESPSDSNDSRYALKVMDRDGSNKRRLFPSDGDAGIAAPVLHDWSPDGKQIAALYQGDLYLVDTLSERTQQLTGDGQCTQLDWAE